MVMLAPAVSSQGNTSKDQGEGDGTTQTPSEGKPKKKKDKEGGEKYTLPTVVGTISKLSAEVSEIKNSMTKQNTFKYFNCDKEGHYARDCPLPKSQGQKPPPAPQPPGQSQGSSGSTKQTGNVNKRVKNKRNGQVQTCQYCEKLGHTACICWLIPKPDRQQQQQQQQQQ